MRFILLSIYLLFLCLANNAFSQSNETPVTKNDSITALIAKANKIGYSNIFEALILAKQAAALAENSDSKTIKIDAYRTLGGYHYLSGNFYDAIAIYQKALTETIDDAKNNTSILYAIGNTYYALGNLPQSIKFHLDALKSAEKKGTANELLNSYTAIAAVYERQNNFTKAIEYNLKASSLFEQNHTPLRQLSAIENIGNIYTLQKKYTLAINYYNKALKIYQSLNNKAGEAITLQNIAKLHYQLKEYNIALGFYQRSNKIAQAAQSEVLITTNLIGIGNIEYMLNNYGEAEKNYKKALQKAKLLNQKFELKDAYDGLSLIAQINNQSLKSKTYSILSTQIKDSLFNDSILARVTNTQLLYDKEKSLQQVVLLKRNEELSKEQLSKERQLRNMLLAIVTLMVLLGLVFFYFYRKTKLIGQSLEQQNRLLAKQTDELTRLNSVKDRFFSIISHDLRNNLTTMKLYFDLMSNKKYKPENTEELTKQIASSVENNIDLLENLLVWAAAQIKGLPLHFVPLNVFEMVEKNIELAASIAHQKNITLLNQCDASLLIYADANTIHLVLRNLIINAIKFTPEGGEVKIGNESHNSQVKITVTDNGIGIDADKLNNLFTEHQNPSTQGTANEKGTGLGLMLCHDFIKQNKGHIYAISEPGKGSTFAFELPVG